MASHRLAGSPAPAVTLFEGMKKVKFEDIFKGKTVVLLAVPGAFTPTCSNTHLPKFVENHDEFKKLGVDEIVCVSCNDGFVMQAWGKDQKAEGKVRMLADVTRSLTKALDMEMDATKMLGSVRSKRYSAIIKNGVFTHFNEEKPGKMEVSSAEVALDQLKQSKI